MNETVVAEATAAMGPAWSRSVGTSTRENARSIWRIDPYLSLVGRRTDQGWSSTLREDSWESLQRLTLLFPTRSASQSSIFDRESDSSHADWLRASVNVVDAHGNLFEIRRLTGLNWTRLAEMLNVNRRTIYNWVKGGRIRSVNRQHVAETLEVLRFADRGSAELNAAALETRPVSGLTAFDLIKAAQYANACNVLGRDAYQPLAATRQREPGYWNGTFRPIVTHHGADGSESTGPLPDEPMPRSRRRRLDRV